MQEKVGPVVFFVILSVVFFLAARDLALGESQRERLLMVYVQSGFESGPVVLRAEAKGLKGAEVTIEAQSCKVRPYVRSLTGQKE
jgi:hypothetical protein